MEPDDLVKLPLIALGFCFPFFFIYLTLKLFNWNGREKLFSNSWLVYIVWITSGILISAFSAFYKSSFPVFIIGLLIVNTLNIATALLLTAKERKSLSIAETAIPIREKVNNRKLWQTSFAANFAAILTVIVLIWMVNGSNYMIEKFHPKPKPKDYGIYD